MSNLEAIGPNADQITYWNTAAGETWVAMQDRLDRQIEPLGKVALAALGPGPGEHVVDIGCGCGQSTLDLANLVGPSGSALGVDISAPMLEVARRRAAGAHLAQAEFRQADAQTYAFKPGSLDAAFSRFGVMFFSDPTAAFANIRRALKRGGRLSFLCWRALGENRWMLTPLTAALAHLPPPPPPDPLAPGPFAFADADRVRSILTGAGFKDIEISPHDQTVGGGDLEQSVEVALRVGPLGAMLREHPDKAEIVVGSVREALRPYVTPQGVQLDSATWIVTARNA